ncbi:unnamed protein product [Rhizoctonia solani]|uniref:Uncharacterized protein n=1 Tax=Rhizoctonia solani TaxID=456999 RepID=A0A8H3AWA2_9AGAM|nr:unnamed protein product [Rhizoctonia solani]CAE6442022.1 unnamed protein product [Rhizoctonia solani]
MKLASLFILATTYVSYSLAQESSISDTGIVSIQPVTPIIPSSLVTRTSTRIGGSQIEPTFFSTSRLTISDASTDRPTPTPTNTAGSVTTVPSVTATSPTGGSTTVNGSSAASSPTTTSNTALERISASPIGLLGTLAVLSGVILL